MTALFARGVGTEAIGEGRERFEELHRDGLLVPPEGPAKRIALLLESDAGPRHQVLRYEG